MKYEIKDRLNALVTVGRWIDKETMIAQIKDNALDHFANFVTSLEMMQVANNSEYVDTVQACLTYLCKDLEEHLDITDCLSIIHNVYMYVASHDEKYREKIGDIIDSIARKEKEACSEEKG